MYLPNNSQDNALMEFFFMTLMCTSRHTARAQDEGGAKQNAFKRIELHCNRQRMHSSIDHKAPVRP